MFFKDVENRQRANVGGLFVVTQDEVECCKGLRETLRQRADLQFWTTASGFLNDQGVPTTKETADKVTDTLRRFLFGLRNQPPSKPVVTVLLGTEAVLESTAVARRLLIEAVRLSRSRQHLLVVVSRNPEVHPDLREMSVLRHPLPDHANTHDRVVEFMTEWQSDGIETRFQEGTNEAASMLVGLTATQQADALSLCLAESTKEKKTRLLRTDTLRRFKETEVAKLGFLEVVTTEKTFDDILGHQELKSWVRMRKRAFDKDSPSPLPRGMMLVGPPGTGKSRIVEAVARNLGFPMLNFKLGAVFSKWLGETEAQVSLAMEVAERMAPCVFFVDEADLALGGESNDGGTTKRVLGDIQQWMATKKEPVFVVFTANFPQNLPAAMTRKGRLDEIWFMDFPDASERKAIFQHYLAGAPVDVTGVVEKTEGWAPAEIEFVVHEAKLRAFCEERPVTADDVVQEVMRTRPVSVTMSAAVDDMRRWASENARPTTNTLS